MGRTVYVLRVSGPRKAKNNFICTFSKCRSAIPKGAEYYRVEGDGATTPPHPGPYCSENCIGRAQFEEQPRFS